MNLLETWQVHGTCEEQSISFWDGSSLDYGSRTVSFKWFFNTGRQGSGGWVWLSHKAVGEGHGANSAAGTATGKLIATVAGSLLTVLC